MKVLIAEDDPVSGRILKHLIGKMGFESDLVDNGQDALDFYKNTEDYHLILLDWVMPGLEGLEVCQKIREMDGERAIRPYIILITAKEEDRDIVEGMTNGADDYIKKPFSERILKVRVGAGMRIVDLQNKNLEYNHRLEDELALQRSQLSHAQKMQVGIMPQKLPLLENYRFESFYLPCDQIGGDLFDLRLINNKIVFYLADYSGHGIKVAMSSAICKAVADRHIHYLVEDNPAKFCEAMNDDVGIYSGEAEFLTLICACIDVESGEMTYCNANHPSLIFSGLQDAREEKESHNFFIGGMTGTKYKQAKLKVLDGEKVLVYSDSIIEIRKDDEEIFSQNDLMAFLDKHKEEGVGRIIHNLLDEIAKVGGGFPLVDDCTLISFMFKKPFAYRGECTTQVRQEICSELMNRDFLFDDIEVLSSFLTNIEGREIEVQIDFTKAAFKGPEFTSANNVSLYSHPLKKHLVGDEALIKAPRNKPQFNFVPK